MSSSRLTRPRLRASLCLLLVCLLAACAAPTPAPALTITPGDLATAEAALSPTQPVAAAPSPAPEGPQVILLAPAGEDSAPAAGLLQELAGAQGWKVETRAELSPAEVTPALKVVAALSAPQNLGQLLSAGPATQFVVLVSGGAPEPAANLSVIHTGRAAELFLAGYLAELVSEDWRVGGLVASDDPTWMEAFLNGGRYHCGICQPTYPPAVLFPLAASLPADSSPEQWRAAADELNTRDLNVMYVAPEASSPELLAYLAALDMRLIGSQPPDPGVAANWVATVRSDSLASLRALWPDLVAGSGGQTLTARVEVSDILPSLLSEGRQRLLGEVRAALESGLILPVGE